MKIEKINDNQIRCTLTREDLESHQIRISELAYGTDKAKKLFRDMMQQAQIQFGFEADNIPLMIEAIPVSTESIILIITKVEDPEELDTRFSRFSSPASDDYDDSAFDSSVSYEEEYDDDFDEGVLAFSDNDSEEELPFGGSSDAEQGDLSIDSALDLIAPFTHAIAQAKKEVLRKRQESSNKKNGIQIYSFRNLDTITVLSSFLTPFFHGESRLYKDISSNLYYLFLFRDEEHPDTFKRACTIASDYGTLLPSSYSTLSYFEEHHCEIFRENALETLRQLI